MSSVRDIVKIWLEGNGYDGLYAPGDCGCTKDDLMPCDAPCSDCQAGHKVECPGPEECAADGECEFHIGEKKSNQESGQGNED